MSAGLGNYVSAHNQGWRIAQNGVVFTGASSVAVTRYRYRGANIPTPWTPAATSG
jgi:RNA-directed DNA polymerase